MKDTKNIREKIISCIQNVGLKVNQDSIVSLEEVSSIEFISLFIEIENEFSIQIPDEYLDIETLSSIDFVCKLIEQLSENKGNENE